ncbi:MobF family relaxase [Planctomycetes bacterium TBK1r]|uniref:Multifunctional conjugation protein TraI n=1 Tax=Stieleria magnilauensis TaxID=2527963 RepID=A0ABX5XGW4_9BACT|nr:Multifunctional conjugation protein TraI [Planctomycetes bacterium TBK1r]
MLTATPAKSIAGTLKYFDTVLTQGDYYLGTEVGGTWNGRGADLLGLGVGSEVTKAQFKALLAGKDPITGKQLAQRIRSDRRPGFDLTFSVPKSVSLAWAINGDDAVLEVLRQSVHETMTKDVEPLMCRRVRDGKNAFTKQRVKTGNLVYADFLHKTSRPVDGVADPHLHIHAFVMNHTMDAGKHYAAEPEEIFRERACLQAKFEARLARNLETRLGYVCEKVAFAQSGKIKTGWELQGIRRTTIEKFARRTEQVEAEAAAGDVRSAAAKGKLGAKTREKKDTTVSVEQLKGVWQSRLDRKECEAFDALRAGAGGKGKKLSDAVRAREAVEFAVEHHLFRQSTAETQVIVGTALEHGVTVLPEQIEKALQERNVIERSEAVRGVDRRFITTREVLEAEDRMIRFARDGRGTRYRMTRQEHRFKREFLNSQQRSAVLHVLNSRDTVTAITGGAGTGKSTLMKEASEGIANSGKKLFVFAPSTGAKEVLEENGFKNAQTVEHLLRNEKLHPTLKDQVLWIDEAGLLDVRSMNGIFKIASEQKARVILSGDTRQHSSPRRGEAMRLLETEAGLNVARIQEVQRQQGRYKRAVELISMGDQVIDHKTGMTGMLAGFDLLDRMGKIKEISGADRHAVLAKRYLKAAKRGRSTLIVAPTHAEGREVTQHIREQLKDKGAVGKEETVFKQLRSLNLSEAQKGQAITYDQPDLVVQFHQNVKGGFKRGERYRVVRGREGDRRLQPVGKAGESKPIPMGAVERFEVYTETEIAFAPGDKIRFSLGGKASDGKRQIANGRLDEIKAIDKVGNLVLKSGLRASKDYGHFDLGYVITSHASQGKDRDLSIAAIGSQSLPAVNAKQFYVTVSRGKKDVAIYVDDKAAVRRAIRDAGQQRSATELVRPTPQREQAMSIEQGREQRQFFDRVRDWWQKHVPRKQAALVRDQVPRHISPHSHPHLGRS